MPQEVQNSWSCELDEEEKESMLYNRDLIKERFRYNKHKHASYEKPQPDQQFELDAASFGVQLWGIGYLSSDWKEDNDNEDLEGEDELYEEASMIMKIRSGAQLSPADLEIVWDSTRLREIYNTRWW